MTPPRRPRGTGSIFPKNGRLWIKYYRNGIPIRESSGSAKIRVAQDLLKKRLAEVSTNTFVDPRDRRVMVDELYRGLEADYRNNDSTELIRTERRWKARLEKHFGGMPARNLTTDKLNEYVVWAKDEEKLSNATINRDLAALRHAFYLGQDAGKVESVPKFPHLKEADARSGFVEEAQFRKLAANAKELWLRALISTAYTFGFRKGELLKLRVEQVSLIDRTIRLNPGETKSGKGRLVALTPDVFTLLQALVAGKAGKDLVFTRTNGQPVRDIRDAWRKLCLAAELPDLIFHDFRRSAVRNMIRRGVSQKVAMKISGHETPSVFDRYDITDEADLVAAAEKIAAGQKFELEFGHRLGTAKVEKASTGIQLPKPDILPS